ncbi:MAG TPA: hypothetical protein VK631_04110 [Solirubrobacteraceae bacterium]|nr:hypothetical protein [Solirubrobacteraceae bacterium]
MSIETELVQPPEGGATPPDALDERRPDTTTITRPLAHLADVERDGDVTADEATQQDSVREVASGKTEMTEDRYADTIAFLLSDTVEVELKRLNVRVGGTEEEPKKVPWLIKAIDTEVIRSAEREATSGNRSARRTGQAEYDELKANLRIVVEGTHKPDLKALAKQQGIADAVILLRRQFMNRPGIIPQIAGEIMALSGFDSDDVRAAGN